MTVRPRKVSRVLSVVHSATFGGPHNQALHLQRSSRGPEGLRLTVVVPDEPGDAPARLTSAGVPVVTMPLLRPRASLVEQSLRGLLAGYPRQTWALRRLIREQDIDAVEVHGLLNVDGALAGRLAGRGVVWQLIDTRPPAALRWLMMPIVLLLADVIMTTGEAVADQYPGVRLRPNRLRVFVPPVDVAPGDDCTQKQRRRSARSVLGVAESAPLVVSVGNLNPQKGYDGLLEAMAACRADVPELALRIRGAVQPGHEAYAKALGDRSRRLGFPPNTVGVLEEDLSVSDIMTGADVFALASTSRSEGLPTVVLEAMAHALPVVATNVGSIAEVVSDRETGIVVPPGDLEQLVQALSWVLADPSRRRQLGAAGRAAVEQVAAPPIFAAVQTDAYQLALDRHQRGRWPHRRRV